MSYCRFSTDNFECDLYCYQSDEGYRTHVATHRTKPGLVHPQMRSDETLDEFCRRIDDATCEIGLPYDGVSFTDETLEDFEARLRMLRDAGYRFPDRVFDEIREEILDEHARNAWAV